MEEGGGDEIGGEEGTCGGVRGVLFSEEVIGKGDLGESGILPSQSVVGLKLLDHRLLIKIDQASSSCAIYTQLETDPVLSTSGIIFSISFITGLFIFFVSTVFPYRVLIMSLSLFYTLVF